MSAINAAMIMLAKMSGGDEIPSTAAQNEFFGYLTRLHESDPSGYCELMKGVHKEIKEGASTHNNVKTKKENGTSNVVLPGEICPDACFVIKTHTTTKPVGADSIVPREGRIQGLYINMACSKAVSAPELPNNISKYSSAKEELLSAHSTSGVQIQIPLLVGSMRTIQNKPKDRAIDVLINTIVAEAAMKDYRFKSHIAELGLQWVKNETGLRLQREWEDVLDGRIYVGGQGKDGLIPVPFPISDSKYMAEGRVKNTFTKNAQKAFFAGVASMNDPIDLLSALKQQQISDEMQSNSNNILSGGYSEERKCNSGSDDDPLMRLKHVSSEEDNVLKEPKKVVKKKLITEISDDHKSLQQYSCMKKGFLIRNKCTKKVEEQHTQQLLHSDDGGSNVRSSQNSSYSGKKFMSRCKVVEVGEMPLSKENKIETEYHGNTNSCSPSILVNTANVEEDIQISQSRFSERLNGGTQKEEDGNNMELDSLLSVADPGTGNRGVKEEKEDTEDLIGEQLSSLAKLLCDSSPMINNVHRMNENRKAEVKPSSLPSFIQQQQHHHHHQQQQQQQSTEQQQQHRPEYHKHIQQQLSGAQQSDELTNWQERGEHQPQEEEEEEEEDQLERAQFYTVNTKDKEAYLTLNLTMDALDNPKAIEVKASKTALQVTMPGYNRPVEINDFPFHIDVNRVKVKVKARRMELNIYIVAAVHD